MGIDPTLRLANFQDSRLEDGAYGIDAKYEGRVFRDVNRLRKAALNEPAETRPAAITVAITVDGMDDGGRFHIPLRNQNGDVLEPMSAKEIQQRIVEAHAARLHNVQSNIARIPVGSDIATSIGDLHTFATANRLPEISFTFAGHAYTFPTTESVSNILHGVEKTRWAEGSHLIYGDQAVPETEAGQRDWANHLATRAVQSGAYSLELSVNGHRIELPIRPPPFGADAAAKTQNELRDALAEKLFSETNNKAGQERGAPILTAETQLHYLLSRADASQARNIIMDSGDGVFQVFNRASIEDALRADAIYDTRGSFLGFEDSAKNTMLPALKVDELMAAYRAETGEAFDLSKAQNLHEASAMIGRSLYLSNAGLRETMQDLLTKAPIVLRPSASEAEVALQRRAIVSWLIAADVPSVQVRVGEKLFTLTANDESAPAGEVHPTLTDAENMVQAGGAKTEGWRVVEGPRVRDFHKPIADGIQTADGAARVLVEAANREGKIVAGVIPTEGGQPVLMYGIPGRDEPLEQGLFSPSIGRNFTLLAAPSATADDSAPWLATTAAALKGPVLGVGADGFAAATMNEGRLTGFGGPLTDDGIRAAQTAWQTALNPAANRTLDVVERELEAIYQARQNAPTNR